MRPRILAAASAAAFLASCGYIGDPLPPLANIPKRVEDLAAVQRGSLLIAHFTIPQETTEGKLIPKPVSFDLRVGTNPSDHFDENEWASHAKHIVTPDLDGPLATYQIPTADWVGKEVILSVRMIAGNGKQAGWSNFVIVPVIPAPATPQAVTPEATAQGVHLTWQAPGNRFRVLRKAEGSDYAVVATVEKPEWIDTTAEFGKHYSYLVQTVASLGNNKEAESDLSVEAAITPEDKFAPAVPAGLHADAAPMSIELAWNRNTEPDLAGYRIFRAVGDGSFEKLADVSQVPTYSDRAVEPGKTYRYTIIALDRSGNESGRSEPASAGLR